MPLGGRTPSDSVRAAEDEARLSERWSAWRRPPPEPVTLGLRDSTAGPESVLPQGATPTVRMPLRLLQLRLARRRTNPVAEACGRIGSFVALAFPRRLGLAGRSCIARTPSGVRTWRKLGSCTSRGRRHTSRWAGLVPDGDRPERRPSEESRSAWSFCGTRSSTASV